MTNVFKASACFIQGLCVGNGRIGVGFFFCRKRRTTTCEHVRTERWVEWRRLGGRKATDRIKTPSVRWDPPARVPNILSNMAPAFPPHPMNKNELTGENSFTEMSTNLCVVPANVGFDHKLRNCEKSVVTHVRFQFEKNVLTWCNLINLAKQEMKIKTSQKQK